MSARWRLPAQWRELAAAQAGVVSRRQLLALGWSDVDVRQARRSAGWRVLGGGVYVTHQGPLTGEARTWAVLLRSGPGAALASRSALAAWGVPLAEPASGVWHASVPRDRHPRVPESICLHRPADHELRVHPAASPPRHRVEAATLDAAAESASARDVVDLITAVLGRRLTDPARLLAELDARLRQPHREVIAGVLSDARDGVASQLEGEYRHQVHLRHRLPEARFNAPHDTPFGRVYRDVDYGGLVVELDGLAYHGAATAVSDRRRDNELVIAGGRTLRFGWFEVVSDPCGVAATVARALGGRGFATPCGPACAVAAMI
ncbi:MAG: hypothetical protein U0Q15_04420 [Kineosporiaceae bacterium]